MSGFRNIAVRAPSGPTCGPIQTRADSRVAGPVGTQRPIPIAHFKRASKFFIHFFQLPDSGWLKARKMGNALGTMPQKII